MCSRASRSSETNKERQSIVIYISLLHNEHKSKVKFQRTNIGTSGSYRGGNTTYTANLTVQSVKLKSLMPRVLYLFIITVYFKTVNLLFDLKKKKLPWQ